MFIVGQAVKVDALKIKYSLITAVLISCLVPSIIGFYFLVSYVTEQYKEQVQQSLLATTGIARELILSSVKNIQNNTALITSRTQLRKSIVAYQQSGDLEQLQLINRIIQDAEKSISDLKEITVLDLSGKVLTSTLSSVPINLSNDGSIYPNISLSTNDGSTLLTSYDQLVLDNQLIGYIKVAIEPHFIDRIIKEVSSLGETGEWIVAVKNKLDDALIITPTRYSNQANTSFMQTVSKNNHQVPITQALMGADTVMWDGVDYAGNPVIAATRYIPEFEWGVVAKIHRSEVFATIKDITFIFWIVLSIIVVIALLIGSVLAYYIAKPLEGLTAQISDIDNDIDNTKHQVLNAPTAWSEVKSLTTSFNALLTKINGFNTELNNKIALRTAELKESNAKLTIEKRNADLANKAKSTFLATMSHEVRTPLNSIHGSLQLLERCDLDDKSHSLVNTARYSMQSLLAIINDVLDFSKIEDHSVELESTYISVVELVEQIISEMGVLASEQKIQLSYVVAPEFKEGWLGDPLRIKQILVNFISNAIKFTPSGSVTITIDNAITAEKALLILTVTDTGIGMPQEVIDNLFVRFSQADSSTTRKYGGTGLGMSICQGLVTLMNGSIKIDSNEGKGTSVTTILPLTKVAPPLIKPLSREQLAIPNLHNKTILLAEDNEINQMIFCNMLEETQANIIVTENGKEALEQYKLQSPDIVFLDIHMPIMDGIEACKLIRQISDTVPIVSITANTSTQHTDLYTQIGFNYHIGKPVDLIQLYNLLDELASPSPF